MLIPSRPAPGLSIDTLDHGPFDLSRDHGAHGTFIVFYRGLHCPICIEQLGALEAALPEFDEVRVKVLAVSADGPERARETATKAGTRLLAIGHSLPLVAARDEWGLWISAGREGTAEPAHFNEPGHFYVAEDGTLYFAWVQSSPFSRPATRDVLRAITKRIETGYPPRGAHTGPLPGET